MVDEGDYGVVRVTAGSYKDRLALYDDDDGDIAIIYLGEYSASNLARVKRNSLEEASTEEKEQYHNAYLRQIPLSIRQRLGIEA